MRTLNPINLVFQAPHIITYEPDPRPLVRHAVRARCSCWWSSDSYAQHSDAMRAAEVHLRRHSDSSYDLLRPFGGVP